MEEIKVFVADYSIDASQVGVFVSLQRYSIVFRVWVNVQLTDCWKMHRKTDGQTFRFVVVSSILEWPAV